MIKFENLDTKILQNFQGGNGDIVAKIHADELNRIVKSVYAPGVSTGYHLHDTSSEIIFILSGSCKAIHEGKEEYLTAGDCHYCKKGQSHAIINNGDDDLVMFAVVCTQ